MNKPILYPKGLGVVFGTIVGSVIALATWASNADAQTYKVVYNFGEQPDGRLPYEPARQDRSGNIYAVTTYGGGAANAGAIIKVTPDGAETVIHSFDGEAGGNRPGGAVTIEQSTGDLYGTTRYGGAYNAGIIYKLTAGGTFTVLHSFGGYSGMYPSGSLIRDTEGNFYGVARIDAGYRCGGYGCGTVYRYSKDGTFSVLYAFQGGYDGNYPVGRLARDSVGNLYGITNEGGAFGYGTAYKLTTQGDIETLHTFTGGADGGYPQGGLARDKAGNLYGTTLVGGHVKPKCASGGCGTVFKLAAQGGLIVLHAFAGRSDGRNPYGDLLWVGNNLYGTTANGGRSGGYRRYGTVFKVAADGAYSILHAFSGTPTDGSIPFAGLSQGKDGLLYGTTSSGGTHGYGTVYSIVAE